MGLDDIRQAIVLSLEGDEKVKAELAEVEKKLGEMFTTASVKAELIGKAFDLAVGAVGALGGALKQGIQDAMQAERQSLQLGAALRVQGGANNELVQGLMRRSGELQRLTNVQDDEIRQLQIMSINMGKNVDETDKLIRASISLANATGTDVNSAFSDLQRLQVTGQTRNVALREAVEGLTKAQIESGDAIDLVNDKFGDQLTLMTEGTLGAQEGLIIAWGEYAEALGSAAMAGGVVEGVMRSLSDELTRMSNLETWAVFTDLVGKLSMLNPMTMVQGAGMQWLAEKFGTPDDPAFNMEQDPGGSELGPFSAGTPSKGKPKPKAKKPGAGETPDMEYAGDTREVLDAGGMSVFLPEGPAQVEAVTTSFDTMGESVHYVSESIDGAQIAMQEFSETGQAAIGLLSSITVDAFESMVEGAEVSGRDMAVSFLKGLGRQVMGAGLANLLEAAAMAAVSHGLDPYAADLAAVGAAQVALGGALIAGGAALSPGDGSGGGGGGRGGGGGSPSDFGHGSSSKGGDERGGKGDRTVTIVVEGLMSPGEMGAWVNRALKQAEDEGRL